MEMKPIVLADVQIEESYKNPHRKFGYELWIWTNNYNDQVDTFCERLCEFSFYLLSEPLTLNIT